MQEGMVGTLLSLVQKGYLHTVDTLRAKLVPGTEEFWVVSAPVLSYWTVAIFYDFLDRIQSPYIRKHRVTRKNPGRENQMTRASVVKQVLLQHFLQTLMALAVVVLDPEQCPSRPPPASIFHALLQFGIGMVVMDTFQYWIHRAMHVSPFLYKHFHSIHHQLVKPYAYGGLYNHVLEGMMLDTMGAGISMWATGMSCQVASLFFAFSTAKTVFDHSGYVFPLNPLHDILPNGTAYHDVHHDIRYIKTNFSQPYFTYWDRVCGTYKDPTTIHLDFQQIDQQVEDSLRKQTEKKEGKEAGPPSHPLAPESRGERAASSETLSSEDVGRSSAGSDNEEGRVGEGVEQGDGTVEVGTLVRGVKEEGKVGKEEGEGPEKGGSSVVESTGVRTRHQAARAAQQ